MLSVAENMFADALPAQTSARTAPIAADPRNDTSAALLMDGRLVVQISLPKIYNSR
jgi:hypothetical protein